MRSAVAVALELAQVRTVTAMLVLTLALASPAAGHPGQEVEYFAPIPGTVLTPYWLDILCIGCNPDGIVREVTSDVLPQEPLLNPQPLVDICNRPFPPLAYDELGLGVAPPAVTGLAVQIDPTIDWDLAVCSYRAPDVDEVRADPNDSEIRWRLDALAASPIGDPDSLGRPRTSVGRS